MCSFRPLTEWGLHRYFWKSRREYSLKRDLPIGTALNPHLFSFSISWILVIFIPWSLHGRRLLDCHKKLEIVSFSSWFRSFFHQKCWVSACCACVKKHFWELHQNKKSIMVVFEPIARSKNDFLKTLFFGYFLLILKNSNFFCFLPHAQPA